MLCGARVRGQSVLLSLVLERTSSMVRMRPVRYPIDFVVKHRCRPPARPVRPGAVEPIRLLKGRSPRLRMRVDVHLWAGLEGMVELTGIEPVTPCLQSRCSPS
jgi:hypothetical protein